MKKQTIFTSIIAAIFFSSATSAQELQPQVGDAFLFAHPYTLEETNVGGTESKPFQSVPNGAKFNIIEITEENYIISFWRWNTSETAFEGYESNKSKRERLNYGMAGITHKPLF